MTDYAKGWKSTGMIGYELEKFAESGLCDLISPAVCGECEAPGCDEDENLQPIQMCAGQYVLAHIENQICHEGVKFMKQLVKEWRAAQKSDSGRKP